MRISNTFHVGVPDMSKTGASLLVVCVQAAPNLWCAYMGLVKLPPADCSNEVYLKERERQAGRIAAGGMKLNYRQALGYFPALKESQYVH